MKKTHITAAFLLTAFISGSIPVFAQTASLSMADKLAVLKQPVVVDSESTQDETQRALQNMSLLEKRKYDELDNIARDLRKSGAAYPSGLWKLDVFYNSFVWSPTSKSEKLAEDGYTSRIALLTAWTTARPKSTTALIALAHAYYKYAWFARGGGYANTVTDTGWKLMSERNAIAHKLIDKALTLPESDPRAYYQMLRLLKEEGNYDARKCDQILNETHTRFPAYKNVYFVRALDLQPRWNGGPGEWERFAKDSADRVGGIEGDKLYAQIVWAVERTHWYRRSNIFREFKLDYARIKRGMDGLVTQFPSSLSLISMYCNLASHAGDKATALHLFKQLAGRVDKECWSGENVFEYWRNYVCS